MKPKSMKTILLAALMAPGALFAQTTATTTPVGYVSVVLAPSKFNLLSVVTHQPTISSGVVASANSISVTVTGANFTSLLTAGTVYILELPDGTIQEISAWTSTALTTPQNISSKITPGTTRYSLRAADTVSTIFGAANQAGLKADSDEDYTNNDLILIPNAVGAFDTIYYFIGDVETSGWYTAEGNRADKNIINYSDGIFVQRQTGSNINLVIDGEVKKSPTAGVLVPGFNFLGAVAPAGATLASSNLQTSLTIATTEEQAANTADYVLFQLPTGAYRTAYYFNDGDVTGWFDLQGDPAGAIPMDTGFLIQNRGAVSKPYTIAVPNFYSTL